ncbi:uncharacterized protein MEPE_00918 [Melanopsichium pennsylvanicum]|uniref:Uncharacterized protein n=2 Tax=Melanopsichium pennsylvanicum TaxID=63383 RepID=A0AAJ4XHL0_9BASI|nr:conserved hypothetical protein [Melanopsichium pennsylvanicum 4]SNX82212.1 uncharacterized protein MEPE_00918 [Melanopsichium pennsylvanicum]
MWLLRLASLVFIVLISLPNAASAFALNYTVSQQCAPLNLTWKAESDGFPYTVWILGNHGFAQTYRINSDYQPNSDYITFQYVIPPPTAGFISYVVAVGDSRGDGNSTQNLGIATPASSSSSCPAYTGSSAFTYAADPKNGSMVQCGAVNFYNIGTRGTRPFTISFIPLGGTPVSVVVPDTDTLNISNFRYTSLVPFAQGTQFQTVLGDASGPGSGGVSEIFTVGASTLSSFCLSSNYTFPDKLQVALPIASSVATFANLPGAISTSGAQPSSGSSHQTGAIAGGAIGGAIALGVAIGCLVAFLLYRRRQKAKRDLARSEEVRFVDLDGDEDEDWAGADQRRRPSRRNASGTQGENGRPTNSSYTVSPFVYEPRHQSNSSHDQSLEMTSPISSNPSYGELLTAAGLSSAAHSPNDDYPPQPRNHSANLQGSQNPFSSRSAMAELHDPSDADLSSQSAALHSATRLPSKREVADEQARRDARTPRRVVQHTDGGSLPQPSSDSEDEEDVVDELPPEYGGWLQTDPYAVRGSSNTQRTPPQSSGPGMVGGESIPPHHQQTLSSATGYASR